MTSAKFIFWACLSICSSVGIILANKTIMKRFEFDYVFSLTTMHFLCQSIVLEILSRVNVFTAGFLPPKDNVITALVGVGSIACMNFNLENNSVGFYQMSKLMCIPLMVFVQSRLYGKTFSNKIMATLVFILGGVGITGASDLDVTAAGLFFGAAAVGLTTQFQIWQGSKREQYSLSAIQITHSLSLPMAAVCSVLAFIFEVGGADSVTAHEFSGPIEFITIGFSCMFAILVNICSFTLIGMSSPITYQVIGHLKTMLVLLGGMLLFGFNGSNSRLLINLAGIFIAMVGVVCYGSIKESAGSKRDDICDRFLPTYVLLELSERAPPATP